MDTLDTKRRSRGEHSESEGKRPRARTQTTNGRQRRRRDHADDVRTDIETKDGAEIKAGEGASLDSLISSFGRHAVTSC